MVCRSSDARHSSKPGIARKRGHHNRDCRGQMLILRERPPSSIPARMVQMPIQTTVVGSYPIPHWLFGDTSRAALRDAIMVVLKTQELAGIDVVADGELNRFDPCHPETNGMIDYFICRMDGIRTRFSISDIEEFRADAGPDLPHRSRRHRHRRRSATASLNLPRDYEFTKRLTNSPLKFTCTGPHMLDQGAHRPPLRSRARTLHGHRRRAAPADGAHRRRRSSRSTRPTSAAIRRIAMGAAAPSTMCSTASPASARVHICFGNYGGQTVQKGFWKNLMPFLNGLHVRSPGSGIRAPRLRRTRALQGTRPQDRPRPGRRRHQGQRDRIARPDRRAASSTPPRCSAPSAFRTSTPTAASGCCSAASPTAKCARWSRAATSSKGQRT